MLKRVTVCFWILQVAGLGAMDNPVPYNGVSAREGIQATASRKKLGGRDSSDWDNVDQLSESLKIRVAQSKELSPFLRAELKKEVFSLADGALKEQLLAVIDEIEREIIHEAEETAERARRAAQVAARRNEERIQKEAQYQEELRGARSKQAEAWQAEKQREAAQREREEQESLLLREAMAQAAHERGQHELHELQLVLSERAAKQKTVYQKKKESERAKFLECQYRFGSCRIALGLREYDDSPLDDYYGKALVMIENELALFADSELTMTDEICEKAQLLLADLRAFMAHPWIAYLLGFIQEKPPREQCEQVRLGKVTFNAADKPWFQETAPAAAPAAKASLQSRVRQYRELPAVEQQKIKVELGELSAEPMQAELLSEVEQMDRASENKEIQWRAEIAEATAVWKELKLDEEAEQLCNKRSFKNLEKGQIKELLRTRTIIPPEIDQQQRNLTRCREELKYFNRELIDCFDKGYDCEPVDAYSANSFLDHEEIARLLSDPSVAANQEICDEALKLFIRFKLLKEDRWNAYLLHLAAKPSSAQFCESVYGVRRIQRVTPERATVSGNVDGEIPIEGLVTGTDSENSRLAPAASGGSWWKAGFGLTGVVLAVGFYKWYTSRYKAYGPKKITSENASHTTSFSELFRQSVWTLWVNCCSARNCQPTLCLSSSGKKIY